MSEWPEQPRLRDALARLADDVELDDGHRQGILSQLLLASTSTEQRHRRWHRRLTVLRINQWLRPVAVAAAAVVVAIGGAAAVVALLADDATVAVETVAESPTGSAPRPDQNGVNSASTSGNSTPPPLRRADLCQQQAPGPLEGEVVVPAQSGEVTLGVQTASGSITNVPSISLVDFVDATDWEDGRHLQTSRKWLAFRSPRVDSIETATSVIDAVLREGCHSAVFVSVSPTTVPEATSLSCRSPETGRTLTGLLLIDPAGPPVSCEGTLPTMVVGRELSTEVNAWAEAYGCTGRSSEPLDERASYVTFDECRHLLAIVDLQRPVDDLWTDPSLTSAILEQLQVLR